MYLRWMVRQDTTGVDLGIWKSISPAALPWVFWKRSSETRIANKKTK
jgi:hypothetical protein